MSFTPGIMLYVRNKQKWHEQIWDFTLMDYLLNHKSEHLVALLIHQITEKSKKKDKYIYTMQGYAY